MYGSFLFYLDYEISIWQYNVMISEKINEIFKRYIR